MSVLLVDRFEARLAEHAAWRETPEFKALFEGSKAAEILAATESRRARYKRVNDARRLYSKLYYNTHAQACIDRSVAWNKAHRAELRAKYNKGIIGSVMECSICGDECIRRSGNQFMCPRCAKEQAQVAQNLYYHRTKKKSTQPNRGWFKKKVVPA